MQGVMTFSSLVKALECGFQIYERTEEGYLMRKQTPQGWGMALVICKA
jgi:hypothetical protein